MRNERGYELLNHLAFVMDVFHPCHMSKRNSKWGKGKGTPQQHQVVPQDGLRAVTGKIEVRGTVETTLPVEATIKRDAAETIKENRDKLRLKVEIAGLIFVILYAGITAWQGFETRQAVKTAQDANRIQLESTRARLTTKATLVPVKVGEPVTINLRVENLGHSPRIFHSRSKRKPY